jgi:hypothetical protein
MVVLVKRRNAYFVILSVKTQENDLAPIFSV